MVILISNSMATITTSGTKPKLENGSFCVSWLIPKPQFTFSPGLSKKKKKCAVSVLCSALKKEQVPESIEKVRGKIYPKKSKHPLLSEGRDEDEEYGKPICPGCGIFMQDNDPDSPGYYQKKKVITKNLDDTGENNTENELNEYEIDDDDDDDDDDEEDAFEYEIKDTLDEKEGENIDSESEIELDWELENWEGKSKKIDDENDVELDGFTPAGIGYGNITLETAEKEKKKRISKAERKKIAREVAKKSKEDDITTVCARCHSLRNYGQVKNQTAENLLPDFDFDRLISTRLIKPMSNSSTTIIVMVVDCVDFDGSFPKRAAKSLFNLLQKAENDPKHSKNLPKLVLVATKVDLLPSQISPARLDRWVRHRAKAGGAPKLSAVYIVSARKDLGVKNLLTYIKDLAGPRGNVWVIGAQNAGKSTLINAFSKKGGANVTRLTEAAVPGTTLGILRIGRVLSAKAKMYDTPGLLHPYLMSLRLNSEERKMVEIRKELQPRSYRVKVGQSVHVGGLVRLDLVSASVETIYITVWASHSVSLHLGKIENAEEIFNGHSGLRLQPPCGENRVSELGTWEEKEVQISGSSWDVKSIDITVAGLGWLSLGLKGEATLALWTYQGIDVTLREPLVLDRAPFLERPGFWLPKAITEVLGTHSSKLDEARRKKKQQDSTDFLADVVV